MDSPKNDKFVILGGAMGDTALTPPVSSPWRLMPSRTSLSLQIVEDASAPRLEPSPARSAHLQANIAGVFTTYAKSGGCLRQRRFSPRRKTLVGTEPSMEGTIKMADLQTRRRNRGLTVLEAAELKNILKDNTASRPAAGGSPPCCWPGRWPGCRRRRKDRIRRRS